MSHPRCSTTCRRYLRLRVAPAQRPLRIAACHRARVYCWSPPAAPGRCWPDGRWCCPRTCRRCFPRSPAIVSPAARAPAARRQKRCCAQCRCPESGAPRRWICPRSECRADIRRGIGARRLRATEGRHRPKMATLPLSTSWIAQTRQRFWRLAPGDREPVVLRHRRIYILPTRRGFAVIATLVIMLLTSMNYALSLGYAMTFIAAGMVAAALLATFRNLAGIASSPVAAGEAFAGGEVAFTLSLASGSRERTGIVVAPMDGASEVIDLPADATRPVVLSVVAPRRGPRPLGRVTLSSN